MNMGDLRWFKMIEEPECTNDDKGIFSQISSGILGIYPLVNKQFAIENGERTSGIIP